MYEVTKIMTNDGKIFDCERDAKHYLENQYNGVIAELSLLIRGIENATQIKLIIDDNIEVLEKIIRLKKEIEKGIKEA